MHMQRDTARQRKGATAGLRRNRASPEAGAGGRAATSLRGVIPRPCRSAPGRAELWRWKRKQQLPMGASWLDGRIRGEGTILDLHLHGGYWVEQELKPTKLYTQNPCLSPTC